MKIFIVVAPDIDLHPKILGASVDQTEAEKLAYAYNLGDPRNGYASVLPYTDLKMPSAWTDQS